MREHMDSPLTPPTHHSLHLFHLSVLPSFLPSFRRSVAPFLDSVAPFLPSLLSAPVPSFGARALVARARGGGDDAGPEAGDVR